MGIVVLGAVFVDIKGYPFGQYIPAGRNAGKVETVHGGVARNVVEDIANVELRPSFISMVDDTGIGEDVVRKLKRHKVNTDNILRRKDGMGTWLAVFDNNGDVVASISHRPDLSPLEQLLDEKGDDIISAADGVVVEIDLNRDLVKRVFKLADKYGKPVYAIVSNMSIAVEQRDLIQRTACFVCNQQEAGIYFSEDYSEFSREQMENELAGKVIKSNLKRMVVTMGPEGAAYADANGDHGSMPALKVDVNDTTGAGDSFLAGVAIGLTYGKTLKKACEIGTRLAASVIVTDDNVCPRFLPSEFDIDVEVNDDD